MSLKKIEIIRAVVVKSTGSWYWVRATDGKRLKCRLAGKIRLDKRKTTNPIAVGDNVEVEMEDSETGTIINIDARKNYIIRKSLNLSHQAHILASNVDQALLVVTLVLPRTSTGFIDRFLVTAEAYRIPAVLLFNKTDLLDNDLKKLQQELVKLYSGIGYPCYEISSLEKDSLELVKEILKDKVSLVAGHSGVGKSTLINLVIGFLKPTKGSIELDGFNLQDLDLRSVRKSISVVPQESILFDGTIKENIAYGLKGIDDAQVIKALKDANALGFVEQLPEGLNTLVGDRGAKLSGGQKQRLAIARALIRQPKILILDEATSALDSESESLIQKAISEILKDKTTFVVAHRLSTVRNATKILVLDHGKIVEQGTHSELLELNGQYANLYSHQLIKID